MGRDPGGIPNDDPLAFFLTWTTYGSWLPGDERGWVEKPGQYRQPDAMREQAARKRMTEPELTLDTEQREIVEKTIADHCRIRGWHLHAVTCRTQHVHVVVAAANRDPEDVMDQFKAWCTRRLKEHVREKMSLAALQSKPDARAKESSEACANELVEGTFAGASGFIRGKVRENWWTQRGSKRRLHDQVSLESAIRYVLEGQGNARTDPES